jgi:hypothetical protein
MAIEMTNPEAEQFDNKVMVSFENSRRTLDSVAFLHANIGAADRIWDVEDDCLEVKSDAILNDPER